jgi:CHAD domain-containing protein
MARETEIKYEADADTELPQLGSLPGVHALRGPDLEQLEAEYYDTADLRLLIAGITLRCRKGGHDAGWHLKLPVSDENTREEISRPLGPVSEPPTELTDHIRARLRGQELIAVAVITTTRRRSVLLGPREEALAEVADDQVHGMPRIGGASASRWREIEVELTAGTPDLLVAADHMLRRAGLQRSRRTAKLERTLGSILCTEPGLGDRATAADVITAYLREHADRLAAEDPRVRHRETDSVHKMRVATRRLRSTLRSFPTVLPAAGTAHLAAELKWLGAVLGEERDAEVQAGRIDDHVGRTDVALLLGPVAARLQAHRAKAAATAHGGVEAALDSQRYDALLASLETAITGTTDGLDARRPAKKVLKAAVGRSFRKTTRRMRAAAAEAPGPARDVGLHSARKAAKRARYAAEAAAPVCGTPARTFAKQMKKVQSVLGDHQDTVVGRALARDLAVAANLAGESAFTYGLFYGYDACAGERLDAQAATVWQKARKSKYRAWLT